MVTGSLKAAFHRNGQVSFFSLSQACFRVRPQDVSYARPVLLFDICSIIFCSPLLFSFLSFPPSLNVWQVAPDGVAEKQGNVRRLKNIRSTVEKAKTLALETSEKENAMEF